MLTIYVKEFGETNADVVPSEKGIITDVEAAFSLLDFDVTPSNCAIVSSIDRGTLLDRAFFLDRFQTRLYTSFLSSGTKAALLVNNSDCVVDIRECGFNAIATILAYCHHGEMVMNSLDIGIEDPSNGEPVEISIDGQVFTTVDAAVWYLTDGRMESAYV